ncbi:hypothetical protein, partial [Nocardia sp. CNY236]|uniref:hypothetical protein n=1 Tax=Nocardia sp. CNY236 TaxID=1169152 RepID=UPI001E470D41
MPFRGAGKLKSQYGESTSAPGLPRQSPVQTQASGRQRRADARPGSHRPATYQQMEMIMAGSAQESGAQGFGAREFDLVLFGATG